MNRGLRVLAVRPAPAPQTLRMDRAMGCEPLELEYLYTVLTDPARGPVHEVTLLDDMVERGDPVAVARRIEAQVVLFTAHITNVPTVLGWATRLKALPEPPWIFVGGVHAEVVPEHLYDEHVDGVLFADALEGIARLLGRMARGEPWDDLPGCAFPAPEGWRKNPGPFLDPAALPVPKRPLLERHPDRYRMLYLPRCASVKTAFGCPAACTFCFCARMHGGGYGPRPVDAVADEIAALPVDSVFLVDDNLLTTPERAFALAEALQVRAARKRMVGYGTADFVARHPAALEALRDAGLEALIVGFEFVTDAALAEVRKRATAADNLAAIATCRRLDVELIALFVVDPAWRHRDFWRLARWIVRQGLCFATFSTLTALPGTAIAPKAQPPARDLWRFDLLRLHQRPAHMAPLLYYLWLFALYMLPGLRLRTGRTILRRYGLWGGLRFVAESAWTGVEFLVRLVRWP
ncbi:MAG: radical SAM protein [Pseudomonadota bacterium]